MKTGPMRRAGGWRRCHRSVPRWLEIPTLGGGWGRCVSLPSACLLGQGRRVGLGEALHQVVDCAADRTELLVQRPQPLVRLLHHAQALAELLEPLVSLDASILEALRDVDLEPLRV